MVGVERSAEQEVAERGAGILTIVLSDGAAKCPLPAPLTCSGHRRNRESRRLRHERTVIVSCLVDVDGEDV